MHWLLRDPDNDKAHYARGHMAPNSVLRWIPTDTEELFRANSRDPDRRRLLQAHGWTDDSIRYIANDYGFRMPQSMASIRQGECDFYLGCSMTFGTGLNIEDTWAYKMSSLQGRTMVNLALPGTGLETQYRVLMCWAEALKPRRAWTLGAYWLRREVMVPEKPSMRMGPWSTGEEQKIYRHLATPIEARLSFLRTADAIRYLCLKHNIELMVANCDDPGMSPEPGHQYHTARDLMHWGREWHDWVATRPDSWWRKNS